MAKLWTEEQFADLTRTRACQLKTWARGSTARKEPSRSYAASSAAGTVAATHRGLNRMMIEYQERSRGHSVCADCGASL
jgi:ribosomal protein L34E